MKSTISSVVVALLAGAALGMLLAPRSGKETRQKFSADTDKFLKDLQDSITSGFDGIRHQYDEMKDNVASRYTSTVESLSSKAKNVIEHAENNSRH